MFYGFTFLKYESREPRRSRGRKNQNPHQSARSSYLMSVTSRTKNCAQYGAYFRFRLSPRARRLLRLRPSLRRARGRFLLQGCPVGGQRAPRDGATAPPLSDSMRQDWRVGSAHGRRLGAHRDSGIGDFGGGRLEHPGSGWAPSGPLSPWECRAAQSRPEPPGAPGGGGEVEVRHCSVGSLTTRRYARPR